MLSRVADSLFWLARNVERAETVARILDVNYTRATDLYSQRDGRSEALWRSVMQCAGFRPGAAISPNGKAAGTVFGYCAFDTSNPTSIVSSVRVARANALGIRAELTTEVWEVVNMFYLYVEAQNQRSVLREGPSKFLRRVRDWMQSFAGISDATLTHGDSWNFLQVGRFLERAYMTARILEAVDVEHEPWQESQRMLEMCCAGVPFAQASHQAPDARDALAFVVLSQRFPRSLRFCTRAIDDAMHRLSRAPEGTFSNDAERRLGRLCALYDFTPIEEMLESGVGAFSRRLVREYEALSADVQHAYFPSRLAVS